MSCAQLSRRGARQRGQHASFIHEVELGTQGAIKIELFSNASLGDQAKAVTMFKAGEIDVAEFNSAPLSEAAPGLKAYNLPFLFTGHRRGPHVSLPRRGRR